MTKAIGNLKRLVNQGDCKTRYEVNTPGVSRGMRVGKGNRGVRYEAGRYYTYSTEREDWEVSKVRVGKLDAGDGLMIDKMGACAEA